MIDNNLLKPLYSNVHLCKIELSPSTRKVGSSLGKVTDNNQQSRQHTCLCYLTMLLCLQEKAEEILNRHHTSTQHALTDNIVSQSQLWQQCRDIVSDEQSFQLALLWLCKEKKCCITTTENQEKVCVILKCSCMIKYSSSGFDVPLSSHFLK